jgi:hypothetical protein
VRVQTFLLAAALAFSAAPAVALAEGDPAARFAAGQKLYEDKSYEKALVELRASHAAAPSPNSRLYIARCLRDMGRGAEAQVEYAQVILEAADRLDPRYDATAKAAAEEHAALAGQGKAPPPSGPAAAEAERHFTAGQKLYEDKSYERALVELRASYGFVSSPNSRLYIARALRDLGRSAEAYDEYGQVIVDAALRLDTRYDATRKAAAEERAALKDRVATLVIDAPAGIPGLRIRAGADEIPPARYGADITVPAARLTVHAEAPGRAPFDRSLVLAGGAREHVAVDLPPVAARSPGVLRPVSFALAGVGVVGVVIGSALAVQASSRYDGLTAQCGGRCPASFQGSVDAGRAETAGSTAALTIGVLALAGGAGLFAFDLVRRRGPASTGGGPVRVGGDPQAPATGVHVSLFVRGPGAAVGGAF